MSFLSGGGGANTSQKPSYTGLQIQTSVNTLPIPVLMGRQKLAPNVMWDGNFQTHAQSQSQGGKGGSVSSTSYTYSVDIMMGLCEGPIQGIGQVWKNDKTKPNLAAVGLSLAKGTTPQSVWSHLATKYPNQALTYPGTAYVYAANYDLGSDASLPNHNYEVIGMYAGTGSNGVDADPAQCIEALLTNPQFGAGFPADQIDADTLFSGPSVGTTGDAAVQTYCLAAGIAISPCLTDVETAQSVMQRWLQLCNVGAVWSEGKLRLIPYGDEQLGTSTASGHRYWRLLFDKPLKTALASALGLAGVELHTAVGGPNIATGGTASASSTGTGTPAAAFDGSASTVWATATNAGDNAWLAYDFGSGSAPAIVEVAVIARDDSLYNQAPVHVTIQYSDDGKNWISVSTFGPLAWTAGESQTFDTGGGGEPTGNVVYTPDTTPIYDLGVDDFQGDSSADYIQTARTDITEAYNVERLTIYDRANAYNASPIEARDEGAVNQYGLRIDTSITAYEICDATVAATVAQLILQRGLYIRNTYQFSLDWRYCLLDAMDLVTLTCPEQGMDHVPVRITSIEEGDDGTLTVTAEEYPQGIATAALYAKEGNGSSSSDSDALAAPVNPPVIFEPPPSQTGGEAEVWIGISGGLGGIADPNWGGANIWISTDNATYSQIGEVTSPARQGVLVAALPAPPAGNPDSANTLAVDLTMSAGVLASASATDAANGVTACFVDGEVIAYENATLVTGSRFNLTTLYRRLYGLAGKAHAIGGQFVRLDQAIFKYALPAIYVGQPLFLKFASFNGQGFGLQDLSDCVAYEYIPTGSGIFGPVATQLAMGQPLDYGQVANPDLVDDDFGLVRDGNAAVIDLGLLTN